MAFLKEVYLLFDIFNCLRESMEFVEEYTEKKVARIMNRKDRNLELNYGAPAGI